MKIAILGNGAWGSALAGLARRHGRAVRVWGRHPKNGECKTFSSALDGAEIILLAVPSHAMREVCRDIKPHLARNALLISVAKGIEQDTDLCMTEVISRTTGRKEVAAMSGPTFAVEVEQGIPSALVCAAANEKWARKAQDVFHGDDFRVYTTRDVRGVELGGALKNVMAIAAGVCAGLGLGDNTLAALITRGLAELSRVGTALGGKARTFYGLSGVGDLILTCSSSKSRNRRVGEALGRGKDLDTILRTLRGTAEGVRTARSVHQILEKKKLEAPILRAVYAVLYEGKPAPLAVRELMGREPGKE